jgi:G3E family GTPase
VLVDPIRAERILGLEKGNSFSPKVLYVYDRQLEEAELILINKRDLLSPERQDRLETALRSAYPKADVLRISARDEIGLDSWLDRIITEEAPAESAPEVDYEIYAEGEALLGWLNASVNVRAAEVDGNELLRNLAASIRHALGSIEIAHLKMTLTPDEDGGDIGVLNLVRSDGTAEISHSLKEPVTGGELLLNLRAEGDPDFLKQTVLDALAACGCEAGIQHIEHFRPAKPQPTYRMASL